MKRIVFSILVFTLSHGYAGVYDLDDKWPFNKIVACFSNQHYKDLDNGIINPKHKWKERDKKFLQKVVQEEYTEERTGIHFVGFKDCKDEPNPNIILFYKDIRGHAVGAAMSGYSPRYFIGSNFPTAAGDVVIYKGGMTKSIIIHEFGHVATLEHEHDHFDAHKKEFLCSATSKRSKRRRHLEYTPYDKKSVMNYCHINLGFSAGGNYGLSEYDVKLLRSIYLNEEFQIENKIEKQNPSKPEDLNFEDPFADF